MHHDGRRLGRHPAAPLEGSPTRRLGLIRVAAALAAGGLPGLPAPAAAANLAHTARVACEPAPNYARCTDPDDLRQLTDGRRVRGRRGWSERAMVGWELHQGAVVGLQFELARPARVTRVRLSTRFAPESEVLPPSVMVATSNDGRFFAWAGAHDARQAAPRDSSRAARLWIDVPLEASDPVGWVRIDAFLEEDFLFVDEVEILGEPQPVPAVRRDPGAPRAADTLPQPAPLPRLLAQRFVPVQAARVMAEQRRAWAMRRALPGTVDARYPDVPLATEEAARRRQAARTWPAAGFANGWRAVRVDPFAPGTPWSMPAARALADTVRLFAGEHGVACVEVACRDTAGVRVPVHLRRGDPGAPRVTLRRLLAVECRDRSWNADALPRLLAEPYELALQGGEVAWLWADLDARRARPGTYDVELDLAGRRLRIPVRVAPPLPAAPSPLHASAWAYPYKDALTRDDPRAAVRDNQHHGVDTWVLDEHAVPWPVLDARGIPRFPRDTRRVDSLLALFPVGDPRTTYGWYWDWKIEHDDPSHGRFGAPFLSPVWRRRMTRWLGDWLAHLESRGVPRSRLFMQPVDERAGERVEVLYRFLHEAFPDVPLALTVTRAASDRELRALVPWIDLVLFERRRFGTRREIVRRLRAAGKQVWIYDVPQPAKSSDPRRIYRHLPWRAWAAGLQGCAVWAYADTRDTDGNAWEDFVGSRPDFHLVYGRAGAPEDVRDPGPIPSRRWEAWRLGLQDVRRFESAARTMPDLRRRVRDAAGDPERAHAVLEAVAAHLDRRGALGPSERPR